MDAVRVSFVPFTLCMLLGLLDIFKKKKDKKQKEMQPNSSGNKGRRWSIAQEGESEVATWVFLESFLPLHR